MAEVRKAWDGIPEAQRHEASNLLMNLIVLAVELWRVLGPWGDAIIKPLAASFVPALIKLTTLPKDEIGAWLMERIGPHFPEALTVLGTIIASVQVSPVVEAPLAEAPAGPASTVPDGS